MSSTAGDSPGAATAGPDATHPPARAGAAVVFVLVALALARAAAAFALGTTAWGLDLLRDAPAIAGWTAWSLALLALFPPLARAALPWVERLGDGRRATLAFAGALGALALVLPDRARFVGDSALREIASHTRRSDLASLYPQGLPLDVFLHDHLMRWLAGATPLAIEDGWRLLGVIEAAALALLAARLARALDARGATAVAVVAIVACGGYLALFAGYNKAFAELTLVVVAVAAFGLALARTGRGLVPLAIAVAAGLLLHRLAIALVPAWIVALAVGWRARDPGAGARRAEFAVAALLPALALATILPHLSRAAGVDSGNFLPEEARRIGIWRAALGARHLLDLGNALLLAAPLAPLALLMPATAIRERRAEALLLAALALPLALFVPFYHPPQGVFRDWDGLAPTAASLSVLAAWTVAALAERRAVPRWAMAAVALAATAPAFWLLLVQHDPWSAIDRARRFAEAPPARAEAERASAWDWLGARYLELGLADSAGVAFEHAARLTPSPRILREWAATELLRGRSDRAIAVYRRLLARNPDDVTALVEMAMLARGAGDEVSSRAAAERALRLAPGEPRARAVLEGMKGAADSSTAGGGGGP